MYVCPVSWITQVFVELHGKNMAASNEALCLEILGKIDVPVCFLIIRTVLYAFICVLYLLFMYCTCTYILSYHPYFDILRCVFCNFTPNLDFLMLRTIVNSNSDIILTIDVIEIFQYNLLFTGCCTCTYVFHYYKDQCQVREYLSSKTFEFSSSQDIITMTKHVQ